MSVMEPKCPACTNIKDLLRSAQYNREQCDNALNEAIEYAKGGHWLCMSEQLGKARYFRHEAEKALDAVRKNAKR